ncbi:MAG TPA: ATP synthase F0 subunit B [Polyangiaceae bacterium]|nr:ATP synthase F0 subunit B [Polyangiaceae bacterium]
MQASEHERSEHADPHAPGSQPAHGADHATVKHGAAAHGSGHAAPGHGEGGHAAGGHGEHHQEFNWVHGMVGVKDGVEPSLLWRTSDMPTPFAAVLLNTALLFGLLFKVGRAPVAKGLADRRQRIMRGIEEATAMKDEAKRQLDAYRSKLDNLDAEIERVKREMRDAAETERQRILADAAARRSRLEQEARVLVEQELKAVREELTRETARAALRSARELLATNTSTDDHRRLCEEYLETLRPQPHRGSTRPGE